MNSATAHSSFGSLFCEHRNEFPKGIALDLTDGPFSPNLHKVRGVGAAVAFGVCVSPWQVAVPGECRGCLTHLPVC